VRGGTVSLVRPHDATLQQYRPCGGGFINRPWLVRRCLTGGSARRPRWPA